MTKRKFDWVEFAIHGFFGMILGAIVGFSVGFFIGFFVPFNELWSMAFGGVIYFLVAGIKRDEFWHSLGR